MCELRVWEADGACAAFTPDIASLGDSLESIFMPITSSKLSVPTVGYISALSVAFLRADSGGAISSLTTDLVSASNSVDNLLLSLLDGVYEIFNGLAFETYLLVELC
jgi:hypothetical protein